MKLEARSIRLLAALYLAWSAAAPRLFGYDNRGPHQMINRLALRILWESYKQKPEMKLYTFSGPEASRPLLGESVVQKGDLYEWDQEWLLTVTGVFKLMKAGDKTMAWSDWVEEGGFTADEPEMWQALRHFYDPNAPAGRRQLTDFKDWNLWAARNAGRLWTHMPRLDAVEWAVEGPADGTFRPNEYSWNRGVEFMRRAFYSTESPAAKDRLFAAAWRALGETMHLLADMTVPAHVRNDSHPGLGLVPLVGVTDRWGSLKADPYESTLDSRIIREDIYGLGAGSRHPSLSLLRRSLDAGLADAIDDIPDAESLSSPEKNIRSLFHALARYTNANFFSQDTFSGTIEGGAIAPANKMSAYSRPRLEDCPADGNYRMKDLPGAGKTLMAVRDRLSTSGWSVSRAVAVSQGRALVPAALYAGAVLADWFIPRIEVAIALDKEAKKLSGKVSSLPHGPYIGRSLPVYNKPAAWREGVSLYIDSENISPSLYSLKIERGVIEGDLKALSKLRDSREHAVELELDLGGILIRSAPARTTYVPAVEEAEPFKLTGSYVAGPAMSCRAYVPRDLGRLTNVLIAWSDYVGDAPVMTASGKDSGLIYLQERYNPDYGKNCWYFGLLIPPGLEPGAYTAEIHYYLDHRGPFTVPVVIKVEGGMGEAPVGPEASGQAYRDALLSDVKSRRESAASDLEKEKQRDIPAELAELRAGKAKRRARYEEDLARLKKSLESATDEMVEPLRQEIRRVSDKLGSLDAAFQELEDELLRDHETKMATLERIKKELDAWEPAVSASRRR